MSVFVWCWRCVFLLLSSLAEKTLVAVVCSRGPLCPRLRPKGATLGRNECSSFTIPFFPSKLFIPVIWVECFNLLWKVPQSVKLFDRNNFLLFFLMKCFKWVVIFHCNVHRVQCNVTWNGTGETKRKTATGESPFQFPGGELSKACVELSCLHKKCTLWIP